MLVLTIMDSILKTVLLQLDCKKDSTDKKSKRVSRMCTVKKEPLSETEHSSKRITRRSLGQSKSGDKILEISEHSKTIFKRNSRSKACKLRKGQNSSAKDIPHASNVPKDIPSKASGKEVGKKSNSLPESKRRKVYSLRQSSQNSNRKADSLADGAGKISISYVCFYSFIKIQLLIS